MPLKFFSIWFEANLTVFFYLSQSFIGPLLLLNATLIHYAWRSAWFSLLLSIYIIPIAFLLSSTFLSITFRSCCLDTPAISRHPPWISGHVSRHPCLHLVNLNRGEKPNEIVHTKARRNYERTSAKAVKENPKSDGPSKADSDAYVRAGWRHMDEVVTTASSANAFACMHR